MATAIVSIFCAVVVDHPCDIFCRPGRRKLEKKRKEKKRKEKKRKEEDVRNFLFQQYNNILVFFANELCIGESFPVVAFRTMIMFPDREPSSSSSSSSASLPTSAPAHAPHPIKLWSKRGKSKPTLGPNDSIVDVTSSTPDERFRILSPFYPHTTPDGQPAFEVPFVPGQRSFSVEGIWQGLKLMPDKPTKGTGPPGTDFTKFTNREMKGLKRARSRTVGHYAGPGKEPLSYEQARLQIYIPVYNEMLDRFGQDALNELYKMHQRGTLNLLDFDTNEDPMNLGKPLAHASLIKRRLMDMDAARQNTTGSTTTAAVQQPSMPLPPPLTNPFAQSHKRVNSQTTAAAESTSAKKPRLIEPRREEEDVDVFEPLKASTSTSVAPSLVRPPTLPPARREVIDLMSDDDDEREVAPPTRLGRETNSREVIDLISDEDDTDYHGGRGRGRHHYVHRRRPRSVRPAKRKPGAANKSRRVARRGVRQTHRSGSHRRRRTLRRYRRRT